MVEKAFQQPGILYMELGAEARFTPNDHVCLSAYGEEVVLSHSDMDKLHAWYKEKHNEGHPFAIRLHDVWYPGAGMKSTKDKGEAQRFSSQEEAANVLCHLNETWQSEAKIERVQA